MRTWSIAWRNVWRHYRRSVITISALAFALVSMIAFTAFGSGYIRSMKRNTIELELGDLQVHAAGYLDEPSLYDRVDVGNAQLQALAQDGLVLAPRLLGAGLAATRDSSAPATFHGIDPQRDPLVSRVHQAIRHGEWLDPADPSGVVIGRKLAKQLGVEVGDELVLLTQAADGSQGNELYRVRGIFKTVNVQVDRGGVFMLISQLRELLVLPTGYHQLVVRLQGPPATGPDALASAQQRLQTAFPTADIQTWRQLQPTLASMLDSSQVSIWVLYFIVYLAIGLVILNAMLMAVYERIREFGVLRAIGVTPWGIVGLIYAEAVVECVVATIIALVVSIPVLWFLTAHGIDVSASIEGYSMSGIAFDPVMKGYVTVAGIMNPTLAMLIIVMLSIAYPAQQAAITSPVVAMRHL